MSTGDKNDPINDLAQALAIVVWKGREPSEESSGSVDSGSVDSGSVDSGSQVAKKKQVITWQPGELTYGMPLSDVPRAVIEEGNTGAEPIYTPLLDGRIVGFGDHTLTVVAPANEVYAEQSLSAPLHVKRAKLTVTARAGQMEQGQTPQLEYDAEGLVGSDAIEVEFQHDVSPASLPDKGGYEIVPRVKSFTSGLKENYEITTENGRLVVTRTLAKLDNDITKMRHLTLALPSNTRIKNRPDFDAIEKARLINDFVTVEKLIDKFVSQTLKELEPDITKLKQSSSELKSDRIKALDIQAVETAKKEHDFAAVEHLLDEFVSGALAEISKLRQRTLALPGDKQKDVADFQAIELAHDAHDFKMVEELLSKAEDNLLRAEASFAAEKKRAEWEDRLESARDRLEEFTPPLHPKNVQSLETMMRRIDSAIDEFSWDGEDDPKNTFDSKFTKLDEALDEWDKAAEQWLSMQTEVAVLKQKVATLRPTVEGEKDLKKELGNHDKKIAKAKEPTVLLSDKDWEKVVWAHVEFVDWLKKPRDTDTEEVSPLVQRMNEFKHDKPVTWDVHPVRYLNNSKGQIAATVGAAQKVDDLGVCALSSNTTAGGSVLKVDFEGHTHLEGGSGGMAFIYRLNTDFTVTPYVVDVSSRRGGRNGNQYEWETGGGWSYYPPNANAPGVNNDSGVK